VPAVVPETRYAVRGDAHIAFQVVGDGPTDVVLVSTWFSHVEARWDIPGFAHFLDRLTAFARVVSFDKLGVGLSDPLPLGVVRPLEEWADEIAVVLDAAGLERAAVVGANEGSMLAILFAATYPERTEALVLADGSARLRLAPDYPDGLPAEVVDGLVALVEGTWGRPEAVAAVNPSIADDPATLDLWARFIRLSASPATATAVTRAMFEFDVRRVLPAVRAPTLVVHRSDTPLPPVAQGRYLAAHIPDATFVEVPGVDYGLGIGEVDAILDPIEEFLTGARAGAVSNRSLATLLFADVVASTERLSAIGDRRWRELLELQDGIVRRQLARHGGTLVSSAGDGFFATFDGPARAVAFALVLREATRALALTLRVGVHVGEVERTGDAVTGVAVHIASRIQDAAEPDQVLVSRTVKDLATGSQLVFVDRGPHTLKGVEGDWQLFEVAA
jgi:class 3 adenylate cyclase/pimeloyl-ACP methyl ester carboxylesterase